MSTELKTVDIVYFAILREHAGLPGERVSTAAATPGQLYREVSERHGFPQLKPLKVAVNDEFTDWNATLHHGDTVVFIPPVAGG